MKKTIFLFVALFTLSSFSTFAQYTEYRLNDYVTAESYQKLTDFLASGIEGSPYLDEKWQYATVITTDTTKIELEARFRFYDNIIEVRKEFDDTVYDLDIKYTKSITIGERIFIPLRYQTQGGIYKLNFFELMTEGQFQLLVHYDKFITTPVNDGYVKSPATIKQLKNIYIYDQVGKEMTPLKNLNKKSILSLFGEYSNQVKDYAKKNKLSFSKIEKLAKIINYYNSIPVNK